jgi:hypothetical protein
VCVDLTLEGGLDEAANSSFEAFKGDLMYWASTLLNSKVGAREPSIVVRRNLFNDYERSTSFSFCGDVMSMIFRRRRVRCLSFIP